MWGIWRQDVELRAIQCGAHSSSATFGVTAFSGLRSNPPSTVNPETSLLEPPSRSTSVPGVPEGTTRLAPEQDPR